MKEKEDCTILSSKLGGGPMGLGKIFDFFSITRFTCAMIVLQESEINVHTKKCSWKIDAKRLCRGDRLYFLSLAIESAAYI